MITPPPCRRATPLIVRMRTNSWINLTMAASIPGASSSQNFEDGVYYALCQLRLSHLVLKSEQKQAILSVYRGKDVFVSLFDKSICFEVLPFLLDHRRGLVDSERRSCAIIVSPFIDLMVNQVRNLRGNGVEAVIIPSSTRESSIVDKKFLATESSFTSASLVFSSPEALADTKWRKTLESPLMSSRVCAVVVDEAHCVSKL